MRTRVPAVLCSLVVALTAAGQAPLVAPTGPQSPEDEAKGFKLPPGFVAQLVTSEPHVFKPMQLAFDLKGRLWVTSSQEYPWAAIGRPGKDKLVCLSDIGPDGKAKTVTTFADDLNIPIGVLPLPDGKTVLVSSIDPGPAGAKEPAGCWIWSLTDTDGDGKWNLREKLYGPFGTRDTHGMVNSFTLMPDGWVYACHGFANDSKVKGRDGHEVIMNSGNIFRFRPDGRRIEVFSRGQVNPFGMTFDPWFNLYTADCHSKPMTQNIRGAVYQSFGKPHDGLGYGPDMIGHDHGSTGLCGLAWYEAEQFPKAYHGGMFLGNVVTSRINWDMIKFHGSTPEAVQQPDFMTSEDLWFRPVDIKLGPDGALYVSDFYNKIIGHYEVDLKHPGRDRTRGRVWRIVYTGLGKGALPKAPEDLTTKKMDDLDKLLGHPNISLRMQATHRIINWDDGREHKQLERIHEDGGLYETHRMWADEAEPVDHRLREDRKEFARREATGLVATHRFRLKTAKVEWAADRERRGRDQLEKIKEVQEEFKPGPILRAEVEWMMVVPDGKNLARLIASLKAVPKEDTHMRHAIRIALRETLRDPAGWTALKAEKLDDAVLVMLADVVLGLPTKDAADFLTTRLSDLAKEAGRLPVYVEHAARHGDGMKTVFAFVTTHKPNDVRLTSALFLAYQRGLQQKGGPRFDKADFEFEALVAKGLADTDGATVQRCFDLVSALKLKGNADAVAAIAARRDRNEAQRSAAFAALTALDPDRAVVAIGKVLADADEPIGLREKAAQVLGALGTPAAYAQLTATLEKSPARVQTAVATALAGKAEGAELLLNAVATGKASGRLLQDRAVQTRLNESKTPGINERVALLTKGFPSVEQKYVELMNQRRTGFGKAKADAKLGAVVFKTNCANCHQLGGEGAKIGPQLDGIGVRGLDRMLEDILDPSRNVDQVLRSSTLNLKDGKAVNGLVLREEGDVIVVADALGKEVRVAKGDVDERRTSLLSPMPANLAETIKEEDFHHLMAYLLQQRPKDK